jgi:hypothetical protein
LIPPRPIAPARRAWAGACRGARPLPPMHARSPPDTYSTRRSGSCWRASRASSHPSILAISATSASRYRDGLKYGGRLSPDAALRTAKPASSQGLFKEDLLQEIFILNHQNGCPRRCIPCASILLNGSHVQRLAQRQLGTVKAFDEGHTGRAGGPCPSAASNARRGLEIRQCDANAAM